VKEAAPIQAGTRRSIPRIKDGTKLVLITTQNPLSALQLLKLRPELGVQLKNFIHPERIDVTRPRGEVLVHKMISRAATRSDRCGVRFANHGHLFLQALQALVKGAAYVCLAHTRHPEH
jgi:hypothetical protein